MPTMTGSVPVHSYLDGPRLTVDMLLKDPGKVPALVFSMTDQQFLADALLRSAGPVGGGAIEYFSSTPFYSDSNAATRAEFGEVPVAQGSYGAPNVAYVSEKALAILVSDEMRRRMNIDPVTVQLQQVRNTLVQAWDNAFVNMVTANTSNVVSGSQWSAATTGSAIRADITAAMKLIATAKAPGQNTSFGFKADTMVVGQGQQFNLIRQEDFNKPFVGNIASENLLYTGKLPNKIMGLDVVVSRVLNDNQVLVMERKRCGFIADELPLQTSAMYRDEPRKTFRCDVQRASAMGLDQPLSMAVINVT
jgi:hypothetical protein